MNNTSSFAPRHHLSNTLPYLHVESIRFMPNRHVQPQHRVPSNRYVLQPRPGERVFKQDVPDRSHLDVDAWGGQAGLHSHVQLRHPDVAEDRSAGHIGVAAERHGRFDLLQRLTGRAYRTGSGGGDVRVGEGGGHCGG